ncbi:hypothetical protein XA1314C_34780 [Xanthomonas arboricola]|uniref:Integrase n=1 Tax=Xanthomonas arboricola TaxID=56448 RepID=A0AAU9I3I5_9XANT|nr:hypothetical protein XA1314C_34780 [Xanthomonas arboricola]CAE6826801.1 hypothetical protein XA1314C_34780 [Xanthomonas arboricola]
MSAAGEGRGKQKNRIFPGELDKDAFAPKCARKKKRHALASQAWRSLNYFAWARQLLIAKAMRPVEILLRLHAEATQYNRQVTGNVYCCRAGSFTTTLISKRKPASQVTPTAVTVG